jgi:hypothetical protein
VSGGWLSSGNGGKFLVVKQGPLGMSGRFVELIARNNRVHRAVK